MFRNISTRIYPPNNPVDVMIQIVANHLGFFEFSLCPKKSFEEIGKFHIISFLLQKSILIFA